MGWPRDVTVALPGRPVRGTALRSAPWQAAQEPFRDGPVCRPRRPDASACPLSRRRGRDRGDAALLPSVVPRDSAGPRSPRDRDLESAPYLATVTAARGERTFSPCRREPDDERHRG